LTKLNELETKLNSSSEKDISLFDYYEKSSKMIFEISKIFCSTTMKDDKTKIDCISLLFNLSSHIPIVYNNLHSISSIFNIQSNNLPTLTNFIFEELQKICSKVQEISTILDEKINKSLFSTSKNIPKVNFPTIPSTITNIDQTVSNVSFNQKEIQISNVIEEIYKSLKEFVQKEETPKEGISPFIEKHVSSIFHSIYYDVTKDEFSQNILTFLYNLSYHSPIFSNNFLKAYSLISNSIPPNNLVLLSKSIIEQIQVGSSELNKLKDVLAQNISLSFVNFQQISQQNIHQEFDKQF
jgi:hypothetical protein